MRGKNTNTNLISLEHNNTKFTWTDWIYIQKVCPKRRFPSKLNNNVIGYADLSVSFPARIIEICSPLLNAWLKSKRVWNSDMNGNQASMAVGMKIIRPITYSYALDSSFTESHTIAPFKNPLQAFAILKVQTKRKGISVVLGWKKEHKFKSFVIRFSNENILCRPFLQLNIILWIGSLVKILPCSWFYWTT